MEKLIGKSKEGKRIRLFSALIIVALLIPIFIVGSYAGQPGRYIALVGTILVGMLGLYEILRAFKVNKYISIVMMLSIIAFAMLEFHDFEHILKYGDVTPISIVMHEALSDWRAYLILFAFTFIPLVDRNYISNQKSIVLSQMFMITVMFIVPMFIKLAWAFSVHDFLYFAFFIGIAIIADTFAYVGGYLFGKKWFKGAKFAPKLSPKKTWAGFVVGVSIAATYAVIVGYFCGIWSSFGSNELLVSILAGLALSVIAPYADLLFSAMKRYAGVKDFSNLIPGHGGVFDRVDAMSVVIVLAGITYLFV